MKTIFTALAIFLTIFSNTYAGIDIDEVKEKLSLIQNTGNSGRDFWFTVPPLYEDESGSEDNFIKVLVTSTLDANVKVSIGGKNYSKVKLVKANSVVTFDLTTTEAQAILHSALKDTIRPARVYKDAAINVWSDVPIIVYVVAKYNYISDGFFALPTHTFGTKYINSAYQESGAFKSGWFSPFTGVVAAYDNTAVTFKMGGGPEGDDGVPFEDGKIIKSGQSKKIYMDKGDVCLLSINGSKQDLSGSIFEGTKPFAIVSGVHCALVPLKNSACDYIVNMEFPVAYWNKDYFVTPIKDRTYNGIIRIYASEDETKIYRDGVYIGTISKGGGAKVGEGYLETRLWPLLDDGGKPNPPKLAHISADKPISVVYYNTGFGEDDPKVNTDPFMMQIPAIDQAVNQAVIYSPNASDGNNPYSENYINITFPLVDGKIPDDLLFAELSRTGSEPKFNKLKDVFGLDFNKFETTYKGNSYGSKNLQISSKGSYVFKSENSKFIAYSYGFGNSEAYGFPSAFSLNDNTKNDTESPRISYVQQCNGYVLLDSGKVSDYPENELFRSNIAEIYVINSENYDFSWKTNKGEFIPGTERDLNWGLSVIDKSKSASVLLYVSDKAGNDTTIYIQYKLPEFTLTSTAIESRNPLIGTVTFQDTIRNNSLTQPLNITRVKIPNVNSKFKIESFGDSGWMPGIPIPPDEERYVNISFNNENIENNTIYKDSLFVGLGVEKGGGIEECQYYFITLLENSIQYPDYTLAKGNDFGDFDEKVKSKKLSDTIVNHSTNAPLYISRIELKYGNKGFKIGGYTPFNWNTTKPIQPNETVIVDILFSSADVTQEKEDIILTDSLGIGISVMNEIGKLEEIEFAYRTEQKATIKALEKETSVEEEKIMNEYIEITNSEIKLLPKTLTDGFTELSIFNLNGSKVISSNTIDNANILLANLQSGTYIITLKSDKRVLTRKINIVK